GGIDHPERVFLGLALLNRYKTTAPEDLAVRFERLLPEGRSAEAAVLGRAMRLGAMLSGSATGVREHATLEYGERLVLRLRGPARDCAGDAVERRLQSLAGRLGVESEM